MLANERELLESWIAGSLRFRRKLRVIVLVALAIGVVVWWQWPQVGGFVLFAILAIYGIGLWITFGHISDWRARIELLDRRARGQESNSRSD